MPLTQEELAGMLGVGHTYISRVLSDLWARGAAETRRGRLIVTDPTVLRARSCNCHEAVRRHFAEVLAGVYPDLAESQALWKAEAG